MGEPVPQIPFFGAGRENVSIEDQLQQVFSRVMHEGKLLNGPEGFNFEDRLKELTGREYAVAVNSATDALYFTMKGLGIGPGDEVLVPAYTFVASADCITRAGATPVFVDVIDPRDSNYGAPATMDLAMAEKAITPRTKAMIWVGLFGGIGDPAPIEGFAKANNIALVEDASQSYGARFGSHASGAMGNASVFSFDRNKLVGAPGTGGAVLTDDPDVYEHARSLRYHGVVKGGKYANLGFNSQMSSLTAAILNLKMDMHDGWTERRGAIAKRYDEALGSLPVEVLTWPEQVLHVRHKYVFLTEQRDALEAHLHAQGVPTKRHYGTAVYKEPVFENAIPADIDFPVSRRMSDMALSLPIYAQMTDGEIDYVVNAITGFYG